MLFNPPKKLNYFNSHFLIQKVGLRGCKSLVQGARGREERRWDSNPGSLATEPVSCCSVLPPVDSRAYWTLSKNLDFGDVTLWLRSVEGRCEQVGELVH